MNFHNLFRKFAVAAGILLCLASQASAAWVDPSSLSDFISVTGYSAGAPQAAMDSKGNIIVVWRQSDGTKNQIFKSEYRNGAWTKPADNTDFISLSGQNADKPQVAMDDNGNAVIVWQQLNAAGNSVVILKSEYRNGVWTKPANYDAVINPTASSASNPQVAMDNSGNAIITWQQSDGSTSQIFKSEYRNGAWTNPANQGDNISWNTQNAEAPQVAMDNNGNALIVWYQSDGSNTQIFKSEYRSGSWTNPTGLSNNISPDGSAALDPQVAMSDNGDAVITWKQVDTNDGNTNHIYYSSYRSGSWTNPGMDDSISPDTTPAQFPQVAMDKSGNTIITWYQHDTSNNQIFKSVYTSGSWTNPTGLTDSISPDGQDAYTPQVSMDSDGSAAVICWVQSDGSKKQIFKSVYRSGSWTNPTGLTDNISPDGEDAQYQQVAVNGGGGIIVWQERASDSNYQIFKSQYIAPASDISVSIDPADKATDVARDKAIKLTFTLGMQKTTVENAFSMSPVTSKDYTLSWSSDNKTLSITPKSNWAAGTAYTVKVGTTANSTAGTLLSPAFSATFTTKAKTAAEATADAATPPDRTQIEATLNQGGISIGAAEQMAATDNIVLLPDSIGLAGPKGCALGTGTDKETACSDAESFAQIATTKPASFNPAETLASVKNLQANATGSTATSPKIVALYAQGYLPDGYTSFPTCFKANDSTASVYEFTYVTELSAAKIKEAADGDEIAGFTLLNPTTGKVIEQTESLPALSGGYTLVLFIKDNSQFDSSSDFGTVTDPSYLTAGQGTTSSSSGCMMNPAAGFGLEWLMFLLIPILGTVRSRPRK